MALSTSLDLDDAAGAVGGQRRAGAGDAGRLHGHIRAGAGQQRLGEQAVERQRHWTDQSALGSEAAVCVPVAAAVIATLLMVVMAPSVSEPAAPQYQA